MNTEQIENILREELKSKFCGVYAVDELTRASFPHRPCGIVCNTQPSHGPGEHWVAIWLEENGTAEYFDSFAQPPDHEMEHFLKRHAPGGLERNHRPLQNVFTTVCGGYVMLYLYRRNVKRHWSMRTVIKELFPSRDRWENDKRVQKLMWEVFRHPFPIFDIHTVKRTL